MRNIRILGIILFAVLAVSAVSAASAFAEDEWLVKGEQVVAGLTADFSGEYLLEDRGAPGGFDIDCSELQIVELLPNGLRIVLSVLNLNGAAPPIICLLLVKGACTEAAESEIKGEAIDLPWEGVITLSGGKFIEEILADGGGEPGFLVECNTLLGKTDDSCTGETDDELKNVTEGVEGFFSESEAITKRTNCSVGGAKEGVTIGTGVTTSEEGVVAVS